jgi:hypothetical protein
MARLTELYKGAIIWLGKAAEHFIRVNVGLPTQTLEENLARLEKGLREVYGILPAWQPEGAGTV